VLNCRGVAVLLVVGLTVGWARPAVATFSVTATGTANTRAAFLPTPKRPSASQAADGTVSIDWPLTVFASGDDVPGYLVERVDRDGGTAVVCTVVAPTTQCVDAAPAAPVRYQVRSLAGSWRSPASLPSVVISSSAAPTAG
jgi:hypothetical protein